MTSGDSDYSDLAHADSDEEHTGKYSRTKKSKKAGQNGGGYRIKNALKVPRATTYTAQALYDQIHNSDIDLDPEYQRAVVWPEAKQVGIIDSIFRNFYIPPVIFCVNVLDDGSETKTCIDGKQRLTSIHRFMDGLIPHKDPITNEKLWYKDAGAAVKGARTRKILPEKYRRLFANKQIVCVEYQDITDGDEREIFQRVQLGMALTPAEKIQVISSPRAAFVRELQSTYLQESNGLIDAEFEWDHSRGADFRCLAQTILAIEKYPSMQSVTLAPLEKWLTQPDVVIEKSFRDGIHRVYRTMLQLVHDERLNKAFQSPSKVAPIEFVLIGLLIAVHMDHMSLQQLSDAIRRMRDDARDKHVDIRLNDRVGRTMLEFVKGLGAGREMGATSEGSMGELGFKRKREEKPEARKMVKKELNEGAIQSISSSANRPLPQPVPRTNVKPNAIPTPPSSLPGGRPAAAPPPPSRDRLAAIRQAQQVQRAAASPRPSMPSGAWANRGTPASQPSSAMLPPRQQTYGTLQESLMASLKPIESNRYMQDGYSNVNGNQRWEYGGQSQSYPGR